MEGRAPPFFLDEVRGGERRERRERRREGREGERGRERIEKEGRG